MISKSNLGQYIHQRMKDEDVKEEGIKLHSIKTHIIKAI